MPAALFVMCIRQHHIALVPVIFEMRGLSRSELRFPQISADHLRCVSHWEVVRTSMKVKFQSQIICVDVTFDHTNTKILNWTRSRYWRWIAKEALEFAKSAFDTDGSRRATWTDTVSSLMLQVGVTQNTEVSVNNIQNPLLQHISLRGQQPPSRHCLAMNTSHSERGHRALTNPVPDGQLCLLVRDDLEGLAAMVFAVAPDKNSARVKRVENCMFLASFAYRRGGDL